MKLNIYQWLQLALFVTLIGFGVALVFGVKVPAGDGPEAMWLGKVWDVMLLVLAPTALAAVIRKSDGVTEEEPPKQEGATE